MPEAVSATSPSDRLGGLLRAARAERGLTLAAVAERTGTSVTSLSLLERGLRPISASRLLRVVDEVGADPSEIFRLAGQVPPLAIAEILGEDVSRSFEAGRMTPAAHGALRRQNLQDLALEALAEIGGAIRPPVSVLDLLHGAASLDVQESLAVTEPGFINVQTIGYSPGSKPWEEPAGRLRLAHLTAHALLSTGAAVTCPASREVERQATYLACALLVPGTLLDSELPFLSRPYDLSDPEDLGSLIADLAARFNVPAWVAMVQAAETGALMWIAGEQ